MHFNELKNYSEEDFMKELFDQVSIQCSQITTEKYSTSFSLGIKLLSKNIRPAIYSIYGFVRLADEIVDSFNDFDRKALLEELKKDTFSAIDRKLSLNPIINSFQQAVHQYQIDLELIEAFLESMAMDLDKRVYTAQLYEKYIYGSAEVVGLMCLKVFCEGDIVLYESLRHAAMKLGSAFQKVNFLRDIKADYADLGRVYFPNVCFENFTDLAKKHIEKDIKSDFEEGLAGIARLPKCSKKGVYLAYVYYNSLFKKIQNIPAQDILQSRVRVDDFQKVLLMANTFFLPQHRELSSQIA